MLSNNLPRKNNRVLEINQLSGVDLWKFSLRTLEIYFKLGVQILVAGWGHFQRFSLPLRYLVIKQGAKVFHQMYIIQEQLFFSKMTANWDPKFESMGQCLFEVFSTFPTPIRFFQIPGSWKLC